jgi:hypothetical protein
MVCGHVTPRSNNAEEEISCAFIAATDVQISAAIVYQKQNAISTDVATSTMVYKLSIKFLKTCPLVLECYMACFLRLLSARKPKRPYQGVAYHRACFQQASKLGAAIMRLEETASSWNHTITCELKPHVCHLTSHNHM